jgi:hypothetical protein
MYVYNMPSKTAVIETVYLGPNGFGSLKQITEDVQTKDDTITYEDVREVVVTVLLLRNHIKNINVICFSGPNLDPVNYNAQGQHGEGKPRFGVITQMHYLWLTFSQNSHKWF